MVNENMTLLETIHDITMGGIDFETMEGYGGLECKYYSSIERRIFESLLLVLISSLSIKLSQILQRQKNGPSKRMCNGNNNLQKVHQENIVEDYSESIRTAILLIYTLVNGIELGYKVIRSKIIRKFKIYISFVIYQIF
jgi:hypothetical protein